ncbi:MAG TPA: SDR family NAD(P)-dependent oxidoreductase [Macromonas sp.]|nr:SDR family NAD(P)-dependent oxidoreductase [Macromonas sp.]
MKTLQGKVVFITGAGSGFGRCLALDVAKLGATPVIADVNQAGLAETSQLLKGLNARHGQQSFDIRDRAAWEQAAQAVEREFGGIDVLINNAGVFCRTESFLEATNDHNHFLMDVNFWGMHNGVNVMVPYLAKRPDAHIVNTASSLGLIGSPMHATYCATKAAVANYTDVIREELYGTSIHVTTVYPGASKTNLGKNVKFDDPKAYEESVKNFEKFASTPPEAVSAAIIKAMLRNKPHVATGVDGKFMAFMKRVAPRFGHYLMGAVYRKIGDPKLYARLNLLKRA